MVDFIRSHLLLSAFDNDFVLKSSVFKGFKLMEKDFWFRRWKKNEIGFHMTDSHHLLQKFFPLLETRPGDTLFVPLCGKSPDLVWLHEQGCKVVGIELSRTAVESFCRENGLAGDWTTVAGMPCYRAEGYQLFCDDFFKLTTDDLSAARTVYDRASLVALPPEMRIRYANHLAALLPSGSRVLLVSYEYKQSETQGPPFAVTQKEVGDLFSSKYQIELLVEEDALWSHQGLVERGVTKLSEFAMLLKRN